MKRSCCGLNNVCLLLPPAPTHTSHLYVETPDPQYDAMEVGLWGIRIKLGPENRALVMGLMSLLKERYRKSLCVSLSLPACITEGSREDLLMRRWPSANQEEDPNQEPNQLEL